MSQFHSLTVAEIKAETRDTVTVAFDLPAELADTFAYQHGQYLTLRTNINGEEARRSYSVCESLGSQKLRIAIKQVPGGLFSTWANTQLQAGDTIDSMPPQGQFTCQLSPDHNGEYLLIAAGSGITPIMSILTSMLEQETHSKVTLIYGNRATSSVIFREQLEDLKNQYMSRLNVIYVMSREQQDIDLFNGRIDNGKITGLLDKWVHPARLTECFICGPEEMTKQAHKALLNAGLSTKQIHTELFGTVIAGKSHRLADVEPSEAEMVTVSITADGYTRNFEMAKNTTNMLEAGLEAGADLPWACKAGVCSTCKCKVVEGEVEMDVNHALEDYEVKDGYVLSCQSYPLSKKVVLNYDAT